MAPPLRVGSTARYIVIQIEIDPGETGS